jgi:histone-lysine N-methyltransferase SETMAR
MDKIAIRGVIQFFFLEGKTAKEIHERIFPTLGDSCPSYEAVRLWVNEFKRGRTSIEDAPRSGGPKTAVVPKIIDKVHDMVLADRRVKVRELAEAVGISTERVHFILHHELHMKKICARWVPRLLTPEQKRIRMTTSAECLKIFKKDSTDFLRRFVTMDETWIHHYTPETKQQSKQWTAPGEPTPKKAKTVPSAGKVMASVFWDAKGILLIDYLEKGKTITGDYYAALLVKLKTVIGEKRPGMAKKKVLFHHDNAPVHSGRVASQKLSDLKFQVLPHPPYSPDLAPSDYHLFPKLKTFLAGQKFQSNEDVMKCVNDYFEGLEENHFREGIKKFEKRWGKCVELRGDYLR